MSEFPPTRETEHVWWSGQGWFATQYKWRDSSGTQHTSDKYPSAPCGIKVNGPYVTFCYHREGSTDKRKYLGKPGSPKYRNFVRHWKQCQTVEEAIAFFDS